MVRLLLLGTTVRHVARCDDVPQRHSELATNYDIYTMEENQQVIKFSCHNYVQTPSTRRAQVVRTNYSTPPVLGYLTSQKYLYANCITSFSINKDNM